MNRFFKYTTYKGTEIIACLNDDASYREESRINEYCNSYCDGRKVWTVHFRHIPYYMKCCDSSSNVFIEEFCDETKLFFEGSVKTIESISFDEFITRLKQLHENTKLKNKNNENVTDSVYFQCLMYHYILSDNDMLISVCPDFFSSPHVCEAYCFAKKYVLTNGEVPTIEKMKEMICSVKGFSGFEIDTIYSFNNILSSYNKEWLRDEIKTLIEYQKSNKNFNNVGKVINTINFSKSLALAYKCETNNFYKAMVEDYKSGKNAAPMVEKDGEIYVVYSVIPEYNYMSPDGTIDNKKLMENINLEMTDSDKMKLITDKDTKLTFDKVEWILTEFNLHN